MPIGIFDSGLGGLTVQQEIASRIPDQSLVYLGDNKYAPYGVRDNEQIYSLTQNAIERLWNAGCDMPIGIFDSGLGGLTVQQEIA